MVKACNAMALQHYIGRRDCYLSGRKSLQYLMVTMIQCSLFPPLLAWFKEAHKSLQQCSISALQHISPHNFKGPWYGYVTRLMQAGYVALFNWLQRHILQVQPVGCLWSVCCFGKCCKTGWDAVFLWSTVLPNFEGWNMGLVTSKSAQYRGAGQLTGGYD